MLSGLLDAIGIQLAEKSAGSIDKDRLLNQ